MSHPKHPCDCCGHRTLDEPSGRTGQICPVCFWEDSRWPDEDGQAFDGSGVNLESAQNNFAHLGACHEDFKHDARPPSEHEPRDPAWRSIAQRRKAKFDALRDLIHEAFRGVNRGGGTSLADADHLDAMGTGPREKTSKPDKGLDWRTVAVQDLVDLRFQSVISFFDPAGYRYYLPAYLLAWLGDHAETSGSFVFDCLLRGWADMHPDHPEYGIGGIPHERLSILSQAQRYVIARFLEHLAGSGSNDDFTRQDARKALANGYWQSVLDAGAPATPA